MATHALTSSYHTTAAGTKLHYAQTGSLSGPLLICLHGLGGSIEKFFPLLTYLPSTYHIILLDFPGFGKSPFPKQPSSISIANHVADLGDLISSLQRASSDSSARNGVIIGTPWTISELALLSVGRAAGHIPATRQRMQDTAAAVRSRGITVAADAATKSSFYEDTLERVVSPAAREAVRHAVLASDPEGYARTCEAIVALDHKGPKYENITAPAVFIADDRDMIRGMTWVAVVKSGHQPILEDVANVARAVDKLLGSVAVCSAAKALRDP
ncbi:alpha/beta-hydrolase [Setomelanomma holmii]|uniref:Alpha/beta-hydrolase n=1 Tax=Setomelanomma holmii TaxID=210430 RepID=A0A9P4H2A3_9PLEO|nr:alpha/beta-hydrolase [Setomelanomma holmii]